MRRALKIAALTLLALALAGCGGWYLRGSGPASAVGYNVYIRDINASTVGRALRQELVGRGAHVVGDRAASDLTVEIIGENYDRRILSVDPNTGKVREVELGLTTDFLVRGADGKLLVPRETLNWQLDYIFDEGSVLGTNEQDSLIERDLAEMVATAMVLRMQSVKRDERTSAQE